jgi:peptidoglycan/xylan/chitin deacetylase (PgdA/CDA1 family)
MIFKYWIKYIIALFFHYSGYNKRHMNKFKQHYILMFHRLDDKDDMLNISIPIDYFGDVVGWSQEIGVITSMSDMMASNKKEVRFCVTFDDGFSSVNHIRELTHNIPFILYISTAYIESNRLFWVVELEKLIRFSTLEKLNLKSFHLGVYDLSSEARKNEAISKLNLEMKNLHPADIDAIIKYLNLKNHIVPEKVVSDEFLHWDDIRRLVVTGMELGGHTHNHVISSKVSPLEFEKEIELSNNYILDNTRLVCRHFAYPNGRKQDVSEFSRQILIDNGYSSAVTTIEGPNDINDDKYYLKRFNVSKNRISNPWGNSSKAMFTTMLVNPIRIH